ncbi:MAG: VCBS repeat-containing protein, partial [Candidatus Neomarinimicrobiota bacterium]
MLSAQLASRQLDTPGQRLRILQGGWDHNANGHPEFLAIHEPVDTIAPSEVVYYEDSGGESLVPLWRYRLDAATLTQVIDAGLADLDGDGLPELAVLLHVHTQELKSSPAWLRVFDWDFEAAAFSAEPAWQWDYRGRGTSYLRPRQLAVADLDLDGADDLVITSGNPDRMVLIAGLQDGRFRAREALRPKSISTGPWPFSVALADFDADGRSDMLIMGHGAPPRFLAYRNTQAGFVEAPVPVLNGGRIRPGLVATADINGDGREEVVIAQAGGALALINQVGETLRATFLDTEISDLLDIAAADLDGDGSSELVFLAADGTVSTNDPRFVAPVTREQVLAGLPPGAAAPEYGDFVLLPPGDNGAVSIALPVHSTAGTFLARGELAEVLPRPFSMVADEARPVVTPTVPLVDDEAFAVQEEGLAVYFPERPPSTDPRALPPHQTPDVLLYVGDEFTEHVLEDRAHQFAGFRFVQKAPSMVFNFQRQAVVWQPTDDQLGAWHVAYEISYYSGVRPEEAITDSVLLSPKDLVREELLIYVNDKPTITSRPETLYLLARQLFAYRILVNDRNPDAHLDYRLETGPEGMAIGPDGILTWRTNETHHDDYQVVISVSDG